MVRKKLSAVALVTAVGVSCVGCNRSTAPETTTPATEASSEGHVHGEWWCAEHGVPEEVCAQCDATLVADFKAKGDWCAEHDRPNSQCFICNPEKEGEFAAQYEAKYGEKPPKPAA